MAEGDVSGVTSRGVRPEGVDVGMKTQRKPLLMVIHGQIEPIFNCQVYLLTGRSFGSLKLLGDMGGTKRWMETRRFFQG